LKTKIEKRKPSGPLDYLALAVTTFGVGYIPGAPGTYGSFVGLFIYHLATFAAESFEHGVAEAYRFSEAQTAAIVNVAIALALFAFTMFGIWASGRAIPLLGSDDPHEAVVDEVIGQLVTFLFVPFLFGWQFILAGFLLFRLFDILKPYPINLLQDLPGGLGVCADDIVAGVYAGICLAIGYAVYLSM
jgi:phosphatidylglycerophosphatase A